MDLIELLDEPGIAFADQPQVDRGCAAVGRDAVQRLADDQVHDDVRLVALAAAGQMGPNGATLIDAARQSFVDAMMPALLLAAAVCAAAALFTAIRGPKTAAEAEPRLHTPEPQDNSGEP